MLCSGTPVSLYHPHCFYAQTLRNARDLQAVHKLMTLALALVSLDTSSSILLETSVHVTSQLPLFLADVMREEERRGYLENFIIYSVYSVT